MTVTSSELLTQGMKHHRAGELKDAERLYRRTLRFFPKNPDAMTLLGRVLLEQGQSQKGLELMRKAARARPNNPKYHQELGRALVTAGRPDQAIAAFRRAVALAPDRADLHYELGQAYLHQVNMGPAIAALERAHQLEPDHLDYRYALASARLRLGELPADTSHFRVLVDARPESAIYHCQLATALRLNNEFEEAEHHYRRALDLQPGFPEALGGLAQVFESTGRTDDAGRLLQGSIDAGDPNFTVLVAFVRICKRQGRLAEAVDPVRSRLADPSIPPFHRMTLLYRLGDLHESLGAYDEAWEYYRQANQVHAVRWDAAQHARMIGAIIDAFSREALERMPRSSILSEVPLFVVGMFRSGTSLTDQVLASHPAVHGAGELPDIHRIAMTLHQALGVSETFPDCVGSLRREVLDEIAGTHLARLCALRPGAARVTDKNPWNYVHLGLIWRLFPGARVILCTRDPLDTCVSCYANSFSPAHAYTQDLGHLAAAYGQYRRLMDHWREVLDLPILELRYEDLVREPQRTTRALLAFCGLDFDEACLRFYESRRVLQTLSKDQIRQPMYTSSIGRAKRFERHLATLAEDLRRFTAGAAPAGP